MPATAPEPADPAVVEARAEFVRGAELVARAEWPDALAAFERSQAKRPHAVTRYNMGVCERALGQHTRARRTLLRALAEDQAAGGGQLSETLTTQARAFVAEIDALLVRVSIQLTPSAAAIAVDGRPLEPGADAAGARVMVAGTRPPGPGAAAPGKSFDVLLDPGAHLFTLTRKGFADVVVNRTFLPSSRHKLDLQLNRLPATLRIGANREGAIVTVDGADVGAVPVDISRPGGSHLVVIRKKGFVPYETRVAVQPGEQLTIRGVMPEEKPALYERWWFWSAAAAVVAGAVVTTVVVTRPDPTRPDPEGGTLGWVIDTR
ncbi:MAG: PEGA domain-containing protein [Polyangiaceae bacterium]